jgi:hypothetical protein
MIIYCNQDRLNVARRIAKWDGSVPLTILIDPHCELTMEAAVGALRPLMGRDIEPARIIQMKSDTGRYWPRRTLYDTNRGDSAE